jgi:hypothetical protein
MLNLARSTRTLSISFVLLLGALIAGCGGGGGDGGGGTGTAIGTGIPTGAITPGTSCTVASGATIPTVTSSNPTSGNLQVSTSTSGVTNFGKLITATFSLAMDPTTIDSASPGANVSFTILNVTAGGSKVDGTVLMNSSGTVATFKTSAPLPPMSAYAAIIGVSAKSAAGVAMGCIYAWNFNTGLVATSLAPVNLGLVASFGSAATAGVTNTATAPNTKINGDIVLDPIAGAVCNSVAIDAAGGFGLCAGFPPTISGKVISPLFNLGVSSTAIKNDLLAAFLSITPPAGPPAAGSLGGATNLPAGTTLGAVTGSAMVQGDNYFVAGVYQSTTSILITDDITLDGQNNPDATFIFQSSSTVGTAPGAASPAAHTRILLINGAKASNVWWQAGTSATLGTFTEFQGNILSAASITMQTGATSCGRLLAGAFTAGAFVFDSNVVSVPGNASAPGSCQ